jgi:hypothetical protein
MAVNDTVIVEISLQTTGVSRAGFGTPIFIGAHRWFPERVRVYSSLIAAQQDIPSTSQEYQAVLRAFQQSPSPRQLMIGRREANAVITPNVPVENDVFTVTVETNTATPIVVSYTALSGDVAEDVVDAIKTALDADADFTDHATATKTGTGASAILTIVADTATDVFSLSDVSKLTVTYTTTETAANVLAAIEEENDDFYVVTAHDHTETFVLAMAAAIEAKNKMYFVSSGAVGSLSSYSIASTDVLAKLTQANYVNTATFWHQSADTLFPELAYFSYNSPYIPGTVTWRHLQLAGLEIARHPTTGNALTLTQQGYLESRNASFLRDEGGFTVVYGGKTAIGEWIDVVRGKHFAIARIKEEILQVLINQRGTKIGYNAPGMAILEAAFRRAVDPMLSDDTVARLLDDYTVTFPRAQNITFSDKASRIVNATFVLYLTGAVHEVVVTGIMTYKEI